MSLIPAIAFLLVAALGVALMRYEIRRYRLALYVILPIALGLEFIMITGFARPLWLVWPKPGDTQVLAAYPVEHQGIYIVTRLGSDVMTLVVPWTPKSATELRDALAQAGKSPGGTVRMKKPAVARGDEPNEPAFYAEIPEPPKPKTPQK